MSYHLVNETEELSLKAKRLNMPTENPKRFLVSPLEWGLGHATRLSRIISFILDQGHEVVIAADGLPYNFLKQEFPGLTLERLPLKQIKYSNSRKGFFLKLILQMPGFYLSVRRSKKKIQELVDKHKIDLIISDNRYGFIQRDIPSVFITHQLRPMPPKNWQWGQSLFGRFHLWMLRHYKYLWVADFPGDQKVVGRLSTISWQDKRIRYIEPQSWLKKYDDPQVKRKHAYDILVMLSGPEPHRTDLEKRIIHLLAKVEEKKILILQGLPREERSKRLDSQEGNIHLIHHLPGEEIFNLIKYTPQIICRAGVVTVFDLVVLQRSAVLIPTPGQTEQEYVSEFLDKNGYFKSLDQDYLTLEELLSIETEEKKYFPKTSDKAISEAFTELLQQV